MASSADATAPASSAAGAPAITATEVNNLMRSGRNKIPLDVVASPYYADGIIPGADDTGFTENVPYSKAEQGPAVMMPSSSSGQAASSQQIIPVGPVKNSQSLVVRKRPAASNTTVRGEGGPSELAVIPTPGAEHWALANRDDPEAAGGLSHKCSICGRFFRQGDLLIAQTDPAYDVDGQLYKLCYDCCQCQGPAFATATVRGEPAEAGELEASFPGLHDEGLRTDARTAARLSTLRRLRRLSRASDRPMFNMGNDEANKKSFKTRARASWRQRTDKARMTYFQRVRCMTYEKFAERLRMDYPSENQAQIRARLRTMAGTMADRIYNAIADMTPKARETVVEAFETFEHNLARKAGLSTVRGELVELTGEEAAGFISEISTNEFLDSHSFQWVDTIVQGVNEYWICRHRDCMLVCPAVCWLKNGDGGWQFRCPACLRLYAPYVDSSARVKAQKLLCVGDQCKHGPQMIMDEIKGSVVVPPFAVRDCILLLQGQLTECILTEWPCTESGNLMNTLRAATLGLVDQVKGEVRTQTLEESEQRLMSMMVTQHVPQNFVKKRFTAAQQLWIDEKNKGAKQNTVDAGWSYAHLRTQDTGDKNADFNYVGMHYQYEEGEPIFTYEQTVMMFAYTKYVCSARVLLGRSRL